MVVALKSEGFILKVPCMCSATFMAICPIEFDISCVKVENLPRW